MFRKIKKEVLDMKHFPRMALSHYYEPGTPFYTPSQEVTDRPFMRVMPSPVSPFTLPAACTFIRDLHQTDDFFSF